MREGKRVITCFAATDNLIKGGAGQAIQSMNLMLGLDERLTLEGRGLAVMQRGLHRPVVSA